MAHPDTERVLSNVVCEQAKVIQFSIHSAAYGKLISVYHQLLPEPAVRSALQHKKWLWKSELKSKNNNIGDKSLSADGWINLICNKSYCRHKVYLV